jgi:hypothetical protein
MSVSKGKSKRAFVCTIYACLRGRMLVHIQFLLLLTYVTVHVSEAALISYSVSDSHHFLSLPVHHTRIHTARRLSGCSWSVEDSSCQTIPRQPPHPQRKRRGRERELLGAAGTEKTNRREGFGVGLFHML